MNTPSRRERIKLSKKEKKVADVIALPIALILIVLFYIARLVVKKLYRFKKQVYQLAVFIFMIYSAYAAFLTFADAPKPAHAIDGVKQVNFVYTPQQQHFIDLINKIWGKDAPIGIAIATCESGINANAINYNTNNSTDFSIFQVNDKAHRVILDPEENIQYAYSLFLEQGTNPWNSSAHCWKGKL